MLLYDCLILLLLCSFLFAFYICRRIKIFRPFDSLVADDCTDIAFQPSHASLTSVFRCYLQKSRLSDGKTFRIEAISLELFREKELASDVHLFIISIPWCKVISSLGGNR